MILDDDKIVPMSITDKEALKAVYEFSRQDVKHISVFKFFKDRCDCRMEAKKAYLRRLARRGYVRLSVEGPEITESGKIYLQNLSSQ